MKLHAPTTNTFTKCTSIWPGVLSSKVSLTKLQNTSTSLTANKKTMWTICTLEAAAIWCSKCLTRRTNVWRPQRISSPTTQFSGPPTLFFSIISKSTRSHSMPSSEHQHSSLNCVKSGTIWAFSTKSATNQKKPTMPFKKFSSCSRATQAHSIELL